MVYEIDVLHLFEVPNDPIDETIYDIQSTSMSLILDRNLPTQIKCGSLFVNKSSSSPSTINYISYCFGHRIKSILCQLFSIENSVDQFLDQFNRLFIVI